MNRREAIKRTAFLTGGAISASILIGVLDGCQPAVSQGTDWKPEFLSKAQGDLVAEVAERIIPATNTPGAKEAGVPKFIDSMLSGYFEGDEKKVLVDGLAQIDKDSNAAHGKSFVQLATEQQDKLLTKYDKAAYAQNQKHGDGPPHFFSMLKQLTLVGFFTSEIGATQVLKYEAVPGDYKGCIPFEEVGRTWAT